MAANGSCFVSFSSVCFVIFFWLKRVWMFKFFAVLLYYWVRFSASTNHASGAPSKLLHARMHARTHARTYVRPPRPTHIHAHAHACTHTQYVFLHCAYIYDMYTSHNAHEGIWKQYVKQYVKRSTPPLLSPRQAAALTVRYSFPGRLPVGGNGVLRAVVLFRRWRRWGWKGSGARGQRASPRAWCFLWSFTDISEYVCICFSSMRAACSGTTL